MDQQRAPVWHMPLFFFSCGVAVTAALLVPMPSPDHQQGYVAGYVDGMEEAQKKFANNFDYGFDAGVRSVTHAQR